MRFVEIIHAKRDGGVLGRDEIEYFVSGVTSGAVPDYQASALLMAIVLRGMTAEETAWLTHAMVRSGQRLDLSDLPGPKVDKHSTGGVGDKTSLLVAPIAAACGAVVPMMSGRGLGHTGGTLDKLEAIPGFRVNLSLDEMRRALRDVGCALIGQTSEIAPADKKLYALRDVTGTVESIPLITASILSKKIAEGIDALVLDVKTGSGAFMKTEAAARELAESLVSIGTASGVRTEAILTNMHTPLGRAVGNALEVIECLETLKGRGPSDLKRVSVVLAARMLVLGGLSASASDAQQRVDAVLASGQALEKFRAILARQGGDPRVVDDYRHLPSVSHRHRVKASRAGFVVRLDAELIGRAAVRLGAGRNRVEDAIDPAVGAIVLANPGEAIEAGRPLIELHYRTEAQLADALPLVAAAIELGDEPPAESPLIVGEVRADVVSRGRL